MAVVRAGIWQNIIDISGVLMTGENVAISRQLLEITGHVEEGLSVISVCLCVEEDLSVISVCLWLQSVVSHQLQQVCCM